MTAATVLVYRVGVLGLGREGMDVLNFLNAVGIKPVGLDGKSTKEFPAPLRRQLATMTTELRLGPSYLSRLDDLDIIFRSPGVPLSLAPIKKAIRRGAVVSSLTQIFFELCPAKIIGVTGTKGKSTTASLIYHLLKGQLPGRVYLGGNIGTPPLKLLSKLTWKDWVILELSSFQLEDLMVSPAMAVLLDVSSEHLDRHKQFKKYWEAKSNIFTHQGRKDWLVASADYPLTRAALKRAHGKTFTYSTRKILSRGLYAVNDEIIYRHCQTGRRSILLRKGQLPLLGPHNLENALAAMAVALIAGLKETRVTKRVSRFRALPHRLEVVGKIGRTQFINDSMATTPVAAIAAIATIPGYLSVIIGGVSKRESLKELVKALDDNRILGIVLIGKSTPRLRRELKAAKIRAPYWSAKDLSAAVNRAYRYVKNEGTVLLAPAFASFDMFKDAYDRGNQFKRIVKKLIQNHK